MSLAAANQMLADLWAEVQQADMARIEKAAKADPEKHRNSSVIERGKPPQYRYYQVKRTAADQRAGRSLRFCYSKHRNVAGFYLTWAEVWVGDGGRREGYRGHDTKADAMEYAHARAQDAEKPAGERKWLRPNWEARHGSR